MQVCAINSGYWDTKVYDGRRQFKFRTKADEGEGIINSANTARVELDGKTYLVGDGAEKYSLDYNKTTSPLHRLVSLYSLSRLTETKDEYKIMVALPLNLYATLKDTFAAYIRTKDYIPLTVDGVKKYVSILDCRVFPEGPAALYANDPQKYREDIIGILDVGSLTVNGCIMSNLNLVRESVFTINAGTIILQSKLQRELNGKFLLNLREYQMQGIIKNGMKGAEELIRDVISGHINEIILKMKQHNWPIESLRILLTGGGSILMEEYLRRVLPGAFLGADPVYDNVRGLYEIAKVVYGA